ncbi:hypothetical protein DBY66_016960 [Pantoea sp. RIT413]|nr:hypothetical protein DBY66_016960 [Pantoea sp. RIT 413]
MFNRRGGIYAALAAYIFRARGALMRPLRSAPLIASSTWVMFNRRGGIYAALAAYIFRTRGALMRPLRAFCRVKSRDIAGFRLSRA